MSIQLPPIYRDCRRLLIHTEESVKRFSRYPKFTVVRTCGKTLCLRRRLILNF
jgi:hypothetical protein